MTVSVSPAFATLWLVPRLEHFRREHPGIEVQLDGTDERADLARAEADVAVRYGPGGYEGLESTLLFSQCNTPVCSPELLHGSRPLAHPDDLSRHTLLHIDWKERDASWETWLDAAGAEGVDASRGPRFSLESMAVQAAADGHGIALVGHRLVETHLATGKLVEPFGQERRTPLAFAYHLLTTREASSMSKVSAFSQWIVNEAKLV